MERTKETETGKLLSLIKESSGIVLAPMIEVNDLSFRLMLRRHNIKLCFTGIINAHIWVTVPSERSKQFTTSPEDHPLICQIAGNNLDEILACAHDLEPLCDGIDINLGCTQNIAHRGGYGYFLTDTAKKRASTIQMIKNILSHISKPLSVKIRIIEDKEKNPSVEITSQFAKDLEKAGVQLISIHGRQKQQNKKGLVSAEAIAAVVNSVSIPVLANGGISSKEDFHQLIEQTGAAGAMIGQGILENPYMFDGEPNPFAAAQEYLDLFRIHGSNPFFVKKHFFYLFKRNIIQNNEKIQKELEDCHSLDDLQNFINTHKP